MNIRTILRSSDAGEGAAAPPAATSTSPQSAPATTPPAGDDDEPRGPVPYDRFREVNARSKERAAQITQLQQELAELKGKAGALDELQGKLREAEAGRLRLEEDLQLARAGLVDDEAAELARLYHAKLPADGRPPLADWWKGLTAETAPRGLQPFLSGATAPAAAPARPPALPPAQGQPGTPKPTEAVYRELLDRMNRGDKTALAEYDALRKR